MVGWLGGKDKLGYVKKKRNTELDDVSIVKKIKKKTRPRPMFTGRYFDLSGHWGL